MVYKYKCERGAQVWVKPIPAHKASCSEQIGRSALKGTAQKCAKVMAQNVAPTIFEGEANHSLNAWFCQHRLVVTRYHKSNFGLEIPSKNFSGARRAGNAK